MTPRIGILSATALLAVSACASQGAKPTDELARARAVIEQADRSGTAQRYAAADLQRAHDELSNADKANSDGKYNDARNYAEAAAVDADVATARGNAGEAQRAATELQKSIDTLRSEAQRKEETQ